MDDNNHTVLDDSSIKVELCTISVRSFDKVLWEKFLASAKIKRLTAAQYLNVLITKELNNASNTSEQSDMSSGATEP